MTNMTTIYPAIGSEILRRATGTVHHTGQFSSVQKRLINILLFFWQKETADGSKDTAYIPIYDLYHYLDWTETRNLAFLKSALLSIQSTSVTWNRYNDDRVTAWNACPLLQHVQLDPYTLQFSIPPQIRDLVRSPALYAQIHMQAMRGIRSRHAITLYEILSDMYHRGQNQPTLSIERLYEQLCLSSDQQFKYFKRDTLIPSLNELNKSTDLYVTFDPQRTGRRITALRFSVGKNPNFQIPLDLDMPPEIDVVSEMVGIGVALATAKTLAAQYPAQRIMLNVDHYRAQSNKQNIVNPGGWLKQAIKEDYGGKEASRQLEMVNETSDVSPPPETNTAITQDNHGYAQYLSKLAWARFKQRSRTFQTRRKNAFVKSISASNDAILRQQWNKNEWESAVVRGHFMNDELISELLKDVPEASLDSFKALEQRT